VFNRRKEVGFELQAASIASDEDDREDGFARIVL
jgi:hypothetical protein